MTASLNDLQRIGAKIPLDLPSADAGQGGPDLAPLIPLFHDWIRQGRRPGLVIDVADYRHVRHGPGVMLVAHEGDWSLDLADGLPGMQYIRKTPLDGGLGARVRQVVDLAAQAAADLPWPVRTDELIVFANDRLRAPNTDAVRAGLTQAIRAGLGSNVHVEPVGGDPRARVALRVTGAAID